MSADESVTELATAVAKYGALPMPVPVGPEPLSAERLAALRKLRTHCEADRFESEDERPLHVWGPSQYPTREMCQRCTVSREWAEDRDADEVVLVAEVDRQAALIAELEAQRERRRVRLVALQNDALSMRGSLSPMGEDRKVPFPLGETLTPAVDWLIGRVAELEALTPARIQTCRVCGAGYTYGEPCSSCEFRKRMAAELQARGLDGEHEAAVHHAYRVGRDLPEMDPARCLKVHPFSPRDGWRMVCGNCDHGKDAECHQGGGGS